MEWNGGACVRPSHSIVPMALTITMVCVYVRITDMWYLLVTGGSPVIQSGAVERLAIRYHLTYL